ncbi:MAG: protein-tyrosine-phosphatase [Bacteroidia bacterium]|nr:protein-tyrosine-phosphatase [Bacteroidia bacterium]
MYLSLLKYIEEAQKDFVSIPEDRKNELQRLAGYIRSRLETNSPANLIFICTHNSRRSHLSHIWAATAASFYEVADNIFTFSGGTETTAFNPRAVAAVERAGFQVENPGGDNPHYLIRFSEKYPPIECFSKKYDDSPNPQENFAAVMTCSHADENCPFIPGAEFRQSVAYDDPKEADGTDEETALYDERCLQIATEMFYLMLHVKNPQI